LLLSVSGVGPKLAVSIVSYISPEGFTTAVEEEDIQTLTLVHGVGRKTAERLIFELKDEVVRKFGGGKDADVVPGALLDPIREAFLALMSLGYERKAIRRVMKKLKPGPESTVEEILKAALSKL
jgi:Holliday junction DNA helicase RuvA